MHTTMGTYEAAIAPVKEELFQRLLGPAPDDRGSSASGGSSSGGGGGGSGGSGGGRGLRMLEVGIGTGQGSSTV
jgi:hypothetical protein